MRNRNGKTKKAVAELEIGAASAGGSPHAADSLTWSQAEGTVWKAARATVLVDGTEPERGPQFVFGIAGKPCGMSGVKVVERGADSLTLEGLVAAPNGGALTVRRSFKVTEVVGGEALTEQFDIRGGEAVKVDLEIVRPFAVETKGGVLSCALPRKDGFFETKSVAMGAVGCGEYRLGEWMFPWMDSGSCGESDCGKISRVLEGQELNGMFTGISIDPIAVCQADWHLPIGGEHGLVVGVDDDAHRRAFGEDDRPVNGQMRRNSHQ